MQTPVVSAVAMAALIVIPAAVRAQAVERAQDLRPFETLELRGCFDARLTAGAPERVVITATPAQHERLRVRQDAGTVTVEPVEHAGDDLCRNGRIEVLVSARFRADQPVELHLSGSGDLDADVPAVARLTARVAGSGDLALRGSAGECRISIRGSGDAVAERLDCATTLEVTVHGSGSTTLNGTARSCELEIHGSGEVAAEGYACEVAAAEVYGSGSVALPAVAELAVEIYGSGDISYRGNPALAKEIRGSGRLRQL